MRIEQDGHSAMPGPEEALVLAGTAAAAPLSWQAQSPGGSASSALCLQGRLTRSSEARRDISPQGNTKKHVPVCGVCIFFKRTQLQTLSAFDRPRLILGSGGSSH